LTLPSSPEEEAARRAMVSVPIAPEDMISFQIPRHVLDEAIIQTVRDELRGSPIVRDFLAVKIREHLAELVPDSPEFEALKEEVREHLKRYPSLGSDIRLQEKVAMAIFGYIQGSNNTYR
jgi:hypothetical protein